MSAVSVAQANIHSAEAEVANAERGVSRARAEWTYANNNLHRIEPLLAKQFVTVDEVDKARTLETAQAEALKQAESRLQLAKAELNSALAQHEQAGHAVTTLEPLINQRGAKAAAVKNARYNLDNCRVYAPFDARVTNLTISEGAYAHVGQQMFTLIDARIWWAIGNFREGQLERIAPGMKADVYVLSKPNLRFSGMVDSVGFGVTPDPDLIGSFQSQPSGYAAHAELGASGVALPGSSTRRESHARFVSNRRVRRSHDPGQLRMATVTQSLPQFSNPLTWLWGFLKEELAPYPGRAALVARMTLAATLVMIVCMTFRIPFAFQGAIYALLISRESPRATLQSAAIIAIVTDIGAAYLLVIGAVRYQYSGASFFLGHRLFLPRVLCDQCYDQLQGCGDLRHHDVARNSTVGSARASRNQCGRYTLAVFVGIGGSIDYWGGRTGVCKTCGQEMKSSCRLRIDWLQSRIC